jgi:excisionase family DNA binding protein
MTGVSASALRIMLKRGEIPYRTFGRLVRIHRDALSPATATGSAQARRA